MQELQPVAPELYDCVVVGAGPAGLTAAIYLARCLRRGLTLNGGQPRAAWIPTSHNFPGYVNGIHGRDLLDAMRVQCNTYGAEIRNDVVLDVRNLTPYVADGTPLFQLRLVQDRNVVQARSIILATGTYNRRPDGVPDNFVDAAMARGMMRMCPICDGWEAGHQAADGGPGRVAVIGSSHHGLAEALYIYTYTQDITIIPDQSFSMGPDDLAMCQRLGIKTTQLAQRQLYIDEGDNSIHVVLRDGTDLSFDTVYPGLGSVPSTDLATRLGVSLDSQGNIVVDKHSQTSVPGVYAAGDVTDSVDQIDIAMAQATAAAITIHNQFRQQEGTAFPDEHSQDEPAPPAPEERPA